jgi:hypothetical protein
VLQANVHPPLHARRCVRSFDGTYGQQFYIRFTHDGVEFATNEEGSDYVFNYSALAAYFIDETKAVLQRKADVRAARTGAPQVSSSAQTSIQHMF